MDVHCSTCEEPWDVYYLQYEAIFETDLTEEEVEVWQHLPPTQQLTDQYRAKFQAAGWEFGNTVINVTRCSCCPAAAEADPETVAVKAEMETLFGDDTDGLAAIFEDHGL